MAVFFKNLCACFLLLTFLLVGACKRSSSPPPVVLAEAGSPLVSQQSAAENYQQHCARCHEGGVPKAPHSVTFQMIGSKAVLKSMFDGVMQLQAEPMTAEEQRRLAEHLGGSSLDSANTRPLKMCG
jgi:polyvinyl alcohol dehydrogenase (cytochrome)